MDKYTCQSDIFIYLNFYWVKEVYICSYIYNSSDDDVYLINDNMAVGYNIYLNTNTDQPERHKYKMKSIRKICSSLGNI
jgi:hypothetical protein